jgi:hypothetical protein
MKMSEPTVYIFGFFEPKRDNFTLAFTVSAQVQQENAISMPGKYFGNRQYGLT